MIPKDFAEKIKDLNLIQRQIYFDENYALNKFASVKEFHTREDINTALSQAGLLNEKNAIKLSCSSIINFNLKIYKEEFKQNGRNNMAFLIAYFNCQGFDISEITEVKYWKFKFDKSFYNMFKSCLKNTNTDYMQPALIDIILHNNLETKKIKQILINYPKWSEYFNYKKSL